MKYVAIDASVKDGKLVIDVRQRKEGQTSAILTKDGKLTPDRMRETAKEVAYLFYAYVRAEQKVPANRTRVVLSSAYEAVPNVADMQKEIAAALADPAKYGVVVDKDLDPAADGPAVKFDRISVHDELVFLVRGMSREDRADAVLIDIGSGNIKCGYYVEEGPTTAAKYHVLTDGPAGTKKLANKVFDSATDPVEEKKNPGAYFLGNLEKVSREIVRDPLEVSARANPGLKTRTKYYLLGGSVWAMATLADPASAAGTSDLIPLKAADFDRYHKMVTTPAPNGKLRFPSPDLSALAPEVKKAAEAELKRVGTVFSPDQLAAGAVILQTIADVLDLDDPRKVLTTVRNGQFTWATSYLRAQAERELLPPKK